MKFSQGPEIKSPSSFDPVLLAYEDVSWGCACGALDLMSGKSNSVEGGCTIRALGWHVLNLQEQIM